MYWHSDYKRLSVATPTEGCIISTLVLSIAVKKVVLLISRQYKWSAVPAIALRGVSSVYIQMVGSDERRISFHLNTPLRITSLLDLFVSTISILNLFFGK